MQLIQTAHELAEVVAEQKRAGRKIGFVPTMGALHQGHAALVERAKLESDFVVVSIFVNPLQFGAGEDFDKYPRTLDVDARLLSDIGADVLFAPSAAEIYPADGQIKRLSAGELGEVFEGKTRPGHFDGMLTVVNRLFDLVNPDLVFFGAKDAQQVALVRRMLNEQISVGERAPIRLVECETVRDLAGLALSSRNRYLSEHQVGVARTLIAALREAAKFEDRAKALDAGKAALSPEARLDYLELVDADSFEVLESSKGKKARLIIAAYVGDTRLIDNLVIDRTS
ncbi:MAG: pantoate--beta-alanine ligase [Actinobacteria bacterium]|nr:pantoate--beta-alanine ligase [Actinomycetota bacterium]